MNSFISIKKKVTLTISLLFITIFIVTFAVISFSGNSMAKRLIYINTENSAYRYSDELTEQISNTMSMLVALKSNFGGYKDIPPSSRRSVFDMLMRRTLEANSNFLSVWTVWEIDALDNMDKSYINRSGSNDIGRFTSTWFRLDNDIRQGETSEEELAESDYYILPKKLKKSVILEPYYYSYTEGGKTGEEFYETSLILPLLDKNENYIGEVGIDLNLLNFQKIVEKITPYQNSKAFLFSSENTIMAHSDGEKINSTLDNYISDSNIINSVKDNIKKCKLFSINHLGDDKVKRYAVFVPINIPYTDNIWWFCLEIPTEQILSENSKRGIATMIFSLICIAFLIVFLYVIAGKMVKPISDTALVFEEISKGGGDLTRKIENNSKDEVGLLATHFNNFLATLSELIRKVKGVGKKSSEISCDIDKLSRLSLERVDGSKTNVDSVNKKMILLDENIRSANQDVKELDLHINKLNEVITAQSIAIGDSSSSIEEMAVSIKSITENSMNKLAMMINLKDIAILGEATMSETIQKIKGVSDSANIILDLLKVINNIASQTNLLAMNAAIEAAHAGESGKGFAVVADEIRNLAENTTKNSHQISDSLKQVIQNIQETSVKTSLTGEHFKKLTDGIVVASDAVTEMRNSMGELATGNIQIIKSLKALSDITGTVKNSSKEMDNRINSITETITGISEISGNTRREIELFNDNINEILKNSKNIAELSGNSTAILDELYTLLDSFKV